MGRLRYNVAASLDGYISGPDGEYDWIPEDDTLDFAAFFAQFEVFLMGRRTFLDLQAQGAQNPTAGKRVVVVSTTLRPQEYPGVAFIADDVPAEVARLKDDVAGDVWLFGGGVLFRSLLNAGLVDTVEVGVCPVLLGEGRQLLPDGPGRHRLQLTATRALPSGMVLLEYQVSS